MRRYVTDIGITSETAFVEDNTDNTDFGVENFETGGGSGGIEPKRKRGERKKLSLKWRLIIIGAIVVVLVVCGSIAWWLLRPSGLGFLIHSKTGKYSMLLDGEKHKMPYRVFVPKEKPPEGGYPVLLYLCGSGFCGKDNILPVIFDAQVLEDIVKKPEFIVVVPQLIDKNLSIDKDVLDGYMGIVHEIQLEYNADTSRLYALGWSMGADSIWNLLDYYPEDFAATVAICGGLFDIEKANVISKTPLWVFHGDKDRSYPVTKTREIVEAISNDGGEIKYTEIPNVGHICWEYAYDDPDLLPWLLRHKKQ